MIIMRHNKLKSFLDNILNKSALILIVISLLLPLIGLKQFYIHLLIMVIIHTLFALSITILFGFTGEISLGQSGFFAIGAYFSALLMIKAGFPLFVSVPVAVIASGLTGMLLSIPARKVKGFYLAIVTFSFGFIIQELVKNWDLTGGFMGLIGIPSITLGNLTIINLELNLIRYYYLAIIVLITVFWVLDNILKSYIGRSMVSVAASEIAAVSLGIDSGKVRQLSYGISGSLAGLGGALYAHLIGYLGYEEFGIITAAMILVFGMLGGLKALSGALFGAAILTILPHYFYVFREWEFMFLGLLIVVTIVFMPDGIANLFNIRTSLVRNYTKDQNNEDNLTKTTDRIFLNKTVEKNKPLLVIEGVSKSFGGVQALNKVSMNIDSGTIHGLIGPNGSGKTTLVNIVSGFYKKDLGKILFEGEDISSFPTFIISRMGITRTFQHLQPFKGMTVIESVLSGAYQQYNRGLVDFINIAGNLKGAKNREIEILRQTEYLLQTTGLESISFESIENIPYGDSRLVELIRAVNTDPKLLILDEPTAGLSEYELEKLVLLIQKLKEFGITIIIIDHHMGFLMELVDQITVLDYGQRIFTGEPNKCMEHPKVISAYLGEIKND